MKNNDTHLIHLTLDGDDVAFAELVRKYEKQVHALVWGKVGDFHIAEEITQDTFLSAYHKLGTLKKPQRFASWLYVIATNRCREWLRKKSLRKQLLEDKNVAHTEKTTYSEYVLEENERITAKTQQDVVKILLAKLEESDRTILTLHYFGDMSSSEIGMFLGVSTNTIKSRLHRAKQRLQKEEVIIREALDNFQITPILTKNIINEISRIKPNVSSSGKPVVPWVVAFSTIAVVLLLFGFGNSKYMTRFQEPYSLDANAKMMVEILDTPLVAKLETNPDVQTQINNTNAFAKQNDLEENQNDRSTTLSEDIQTEETMTEYTQWEIPREAIGRLGKGKVNNINFTPDGSHLIVGTSIGVWLYNANTGEEIALFTYVGGDNHRLDRSYMNMLVSTIDGNTIECPGLVGNKDLWNLDKESLKSILPDLRRRNNVLQFKASNIKLTYSGWSKNLPWHVKTGLWNLNDETDKPIESRLSMMEMEWGMQIAISPDERYLAAAHRNSYWNNEYQIPIIHVWDRTTGQRVFTVEESKDDIITLVFSPDNKTLAYADSSNIVKLWDVQSSSLQYMFKAKVPFQTLTFTPDGSLLASGSTDGIVRFWKVVKYGKQSIPDRVFNTVGKQQPDKMLIGHVDNSIFTAINFSPDGKRWQVRILMVLSVYGIPFRENNNLHLHNTPDRKLHWHSALSTNPLCMTLLTGHLPVWGRVNPIYSFRFGILILETGFLLIGLKKVII